MDNGGSVKRIDAIQKYKEGDEWLHALVYKFIDNKNIVTGGGLDEAPAGVVLDIICEAVAGGGCLLRLVPQINPSVPQPVVQSRRRPLLEHYTALILM